MAFVEKQLTTIVTPNHLCAVNLYTEIKQEQSVQLNQTAIINMTLKNAAQTMDY